MNELICQDLIVDENQIKDEFNFYYWEGEGKRVTFILKEGNIKKTGEEELHYDMNYNQLHFSNMSALIRQKIKRYNWFSQNQVLQMRRFPDNRFDMRNFVHKLEITPGFNKKYLPNDEIVFKTEKRLINRWKIKRFMRSNQLQEFTDEELKIRVHKIVFKEQIISYLVQAFPKYFILGKGIIGFFQSLNEHDSGKSFDEYIDNWVKEIMGKIEAGVL